MRGGAETGLARLLPSGNLAGSLYGIVLLSDGFGSQAAVETVRALVVAGPRTGFKM